MIKNFDEEQIWQQLELQNDGALRYFTKAVARNVDDNEEDLSLLPATEEEESVSEEHEKETDEEDQMEEESDLYSDQLEEESEPEIKRSSLGAKEAHTFSDEESDIDFDIEELEQRTRSPKSTLKITGDRSVVDDRFFKLAEMEAVLDAVEKKEARAKEDSEDEEEVDYFEDIFSEDDAEDDEEFGFSRTKVNEAKKRVG